MSLKYIGLACLMSAIIASAATFYFVPQIKAVEVTKDVIRTDIQTVVHTVTLPSGAIDSTTTVVDHTKRVETDNKTTTQSIPKNWLVSGSYSTDIHNLEPVYGIQAQRRILGNLFVGALLNTKGMVGLSIGLAF